MTTGAYGLSSVILPPVITGIVARYSAPFAFKAIGLVFAVIILGSALVIQTCPKDYLPAGMHKHNGGNVHSVSMNWKQMLSTPVFYVMLLLLACGAFSGNMIISQASSIAQNKTGMTVYTAALAVSVLALFNAGGRFLAGLVSDRIGRINTLVIAYVLSHHRIGGSVYGASRLLCSAVYWCFDYRTVLWLIYGRFPRFHGRPVWGETQQPQLRHYVRWFFYGGFLWPDHYAEHLPPNRLLSTGFAHCVRDECLGDSAHIPVSLHIKQARKPQWCFKLRKFIEHVLNFVDYCFAFVSTILLTHCSNEGLRSCSSIAL